MADGALEDVLARLAPLGAVRSRAMFGGHGLYLAEVFFGLVAAERLYFKVDDTTRGEYVKLGSEPFRPFADKPPMGGYYEVPERSISDARRLRTLALQAVEVARAAQAAKGKKRARRSPKRSAPALKLGPKLRLRLAEIGIHSHSDLERVGSVAAFRAMKARGHAPGANVLYALEGALLGLRWNRVPDVVRADLARRAGLARLKS